MAPQAWGFQISANVNIGDSEDQGEIITTEALAPTELTFNGTAIVMNYTLTQTSDIRFTFNTSGTGRAIFLVNEPLNVTNSDYTYTAGNGTLNLYPTGYKALTIVYAAAPVAGAFPLGLFVIAMLIVAIPIVIYTQRVK